MNLGNLKTNGRSVGLVWIIAGGLAIILGGLLLSTLTPSLFPTEGSMQAQQVDNLFRFMLAIGGAIFLLVNGVLLFSVIRFRARKGDNSDGPPIQGNTTLEFIWTVIPAIIVAVITIYSYQVWTTIRAPQANEQIVHAVGQRFAWSFSYDIPQDALPEGVTLEQLPEDVRAVYDSGEERSFSSPQLHTWVGQPVQVLLNTEDVNHAFWIPGMRVKQDLLGGRETDIRFTPIVEGPYRIVCAELCGAGHGNMAGTVETVSGEPVLQGAWLIVHPDEETFLREFYNPEAMKALFPPDDPVELGQQLLSGADYPCATCHTLSTVGWTGNLAPNLDGIGTRAANRVPGQTAEAYIYNSLRHPADFLVPGFSNIMPQFNDEPSETNYMPEEPDLEAIVAFLLTQ
jgi:cytochrome c oxidase subunit 2